MYESRIRIQSDMSPHYSESLSVCGRESIIEEVISAPLLTQQMKEIIPSEESETVEQKMEYPPNLSIIEIFNPYAERSTWRKGEKTQSEPDVYESDSKFEQKTISCKSESNLSNLHKSSLLGLSFPSLPIPKPFLSSSQMQSQEVLHGYSFQVKSSSDSQVQKAMQDITLPTSQTHLISSKLECTSSGIIKDELIVTSSEQLDITEQNTIFLKRVRSQLTQLSEEIVENTFKKIVNDLSCSFSFVRTASEVCFATITEIQPTDNWSPLESTRKEIENKNLEGLISNLEVSYIAKDVTEHIFEKLESAVLETCTSTSPKEEECIESQAAQQTSVHELKGISEETPILLSSSFLYGTAREIIDTVSDKLEAFAISKQLQLHETQQSASRISLTEHVLQNICDSSLEVSKTSSTPSRTTIAPDEECVGLGYSGVREEIKKYIFKTDLSGSKIFTCIGDILKTVLGEIVKELAVNISKKTSREKVSLSKQRDVLYELVINILNQLNAYEAEDTLHTGKPRTAKTETIFHDTTNEQCYAVVSKTETLPISRRQSIVCQRTEPCAPVNVPGMVIYSDGESEEDSSYLISCCTEHERSTDTARLHYDSCVLETFDRLSRVSVGPDAEDVAFCNEALIMENKNNNKIMKSPMVMAAEMVVSDIFTKLIADVDYFSSLNKSSEDCKINLSLEQKLTLEMSNTKQSSIIQPFPVSDIEFFALDITESIVKMLNKASKQESISNIQEFLANDRVHSEHVFAKGTDNSATVSSEQASHMNILTKDETDPMKDTSCQTFTTSNVECLLESVTQSAPMLRNIDEQIVHMILIKIRNFFDLKSKSDSRFNTIKKAFSNEFTLCAEMPQLLQAVLDPFPNEPSRKISKDTTCYGNIVKHEQTGSTVRTQQSELALYANKVIRDTLYVIQRELNADVLKKSLVSSETYYNDNSSLSDDRASVISLPDKNLASSEKTLTSQNSLIANTLVSSILKIISSERYAKEVVSAYSFEYSQGSTLEVNYFKKCTALPTQNCCSKVCVLHCVGKRVESEITSLVADIVSEMIQKVVNNPIGSSTDLSLIHIPTSQENCLKKRSVEELSHRQSATELVSIDVVNVILKSLCNFITDHTATVTDYRNRSGLQDPCIIEGELTDNFTQQLTSSMLVAIAEDMFTNVVAKLNSYVNLKLDSLQKTKPDLDNIVDPLEMKRNQSMQIFTSEELVAHADSSSTNAKSKESSRFDFQCKLYSYAKEIATTILNVIKDTSSKENQSGILTMIKSPEEKNTIKSIHNLIAGPSSVEKHKMGNDFPDDTELMIQNTVPSDNFHLGECTTKSGSSSVCGEDIKETLYISISGPSPSVINKIKNDFPDDTKLEEQLHAVTSYNIHLGEYTSKSVSSSVYAEDINETLYRSSHGPSSAEINKITNFFPVDTKLEEQLYTVTSYNVRLGEFTSKSVTPSVYAEDINKTLYSSTHGPSSAEINKMKNYFPDDTKLEEHLDVVTGDNIHLGECTSKSVASSVCAEDITETLYRATSASDKQAGFQKPPMESHSLSKQLCTYSDQSIVLKLLKNVQDYIFRRIFKRMQEGYNEPERSQVIEGVKLILGDIFLKYFIDFILPPFFTHSGELSDTYKNIIYETFIKLNEKALCPFDSATKTFPLADDVLKTIFVKFHSAFFSDVNVNETICFSDCKRTIKHPNHLTDTCSMNKGPIEMEVTDTKVANSTNLLAVDFLKSQFRTDDGVNVKPSHSDSNMDDILKEVFSRFETFDTLKNESFQCSDTPNESRAKYPSTVSLGVQTPCLVSKKSKYTSTEGLLEDKAGRPAENRRVPASPRLHAKLNHYAIEVVNTIVSGIKNKIEGDIENKLIGLVPENKSIVANKIIQKVLDRVLQATGSHKNDLKLKKSFQFESPASASSQSFFEKNAESCYLESCLQERILANTELSCSRQESDAANCTAKVCMTHPSQQSQVTGKSSPYLTSHRKQQNVFEKILNEEPSYREQLECQIGHTVEHALVDIFQRRMYDFENYTPHVNDCCEQETFNNNVSQLSESNNTNKANVNSLSNSDISYVSNEMVKIVLDNLCSSAGNETYENCSNFSQLTFVPKASAQNMIENVATRLKSFMDLPADSKFIVNLRSEKDVTTAKSSTTTSENLKDHAESWHGQAANRESIGSAIDSRPISTYSRTIKNTCEHNCKYHSFSRTADSDSQLVGHAELIVSGILELIKRDIDNKILKTGSNKSISSDQRLAREVVSNLLLATTTQSRMRCVTLTREHLCKKMPTQQQEAAGSGVKKKNVCVALSNIKRPNSHASSVDTGSNQVNRKSAILKNKSAKTCKRLASHDSVNASLQPISKNKKKDSVCPLCNSSQDGNLLKHTVSSSNDQVELGDLQNAVEQFTPGTEKKSTASDTNKKADKSKGVLHAMLALKDVKLREKLHSKICEAVIEPLSNIFLRITENAQCLTPGSSAVAKCRRHASHAQSSTQSVLKNKMIRNTIIGPKFYFVADNLIDHVLETLQSAAVPCGNKNHLIMGKDSAYCSDTVKKQKNATNIQCRSKKEEGTVCHEKDHVCSSSLITKDANGALRNSKCHSPHSSFNLKPFDSQLCKNMNSKRVPQVDTNAIAEDILETISNKLNVFFTLKLQDLILPGEERTPTLFNLMEASDVCLTQSQTIMPTPDPTTDFNFCDDESSVDDLNRSNSSMLAVNIVEKSVQYSELKCIAVEVARIILSFTKKQLDREQQRNSLNKRYMAFNANVMASTIINHVLEVFLTMKLSELHSTSAVCSTESTFETTTANTSSRTSSILPIPTRITQDKENDNMYLKQHSRFAVETDMTIQKCSRKNRKHFHNNLTKDQFKLPRSHSYNTVYSSSESSTQRTTEIPSTALNSGDMKMYSLQRKDHLNVHSGDGKDKTLTQIASNLNHSQCTMNLEADFETNCVKHLMDHLQFSEKNKLSCEPFTTKQMNSLQDWSASRHCPKKAILKELSDSNTENLHTEYSSDCSSENAETSNHLMMKTSKRQIPFNRKKQSSSIPGIINCFAFETEKGEKVMMMTFPNPNRAIHSEVATPFSKHRKQSFTQSNDTNENCVSKLNYFEDRSEKKCETNKVNTSKNVKDLSRSSCNCRYSEDILSTEKQLNVADLIESDDEISLTELSHPTIDLMSTTNSITSCPSSLSTNVSSLEVSSQSSETCVTEEVLENSDQSDCTEPSFNQHRPEVPKQKHMSSQEWWRSLPSDESDCTQPSFKQHPPEVPKQKHVSSQEWWRGLPSDESDCTQPSFSLHPPEVPKPKHTSSQEWWQSLPSDQSDCTQPSFNQHPPETPKPKHVSSQERWQSLPSDQSDCTQLSFNQNPPEEPKPKQVSSQEWWRNLPSDFSDEEADFRRISYTCEKKEREMQTDTSVAENSVHRSEAEGKDQTLKHENAPKEDLIKDSGDEGETENIIKWDGRNPMINLFSEILVKLVVEDILSRVSEAKNVTKHKIKENIEFYRTFLKWSCKDSVTLVINKIADSIQKQRTGSVANNLSQRNNFIFQSELISSISKHDVISMCQSVEELLTQKSFDIFKKHMCKSGMQWLSEQIVGIVIETLTLIFSKASLKLPAIKSQNISKSHSTARLSKSDISSMTINEGPQQNASQNVKDALVVNSCLNGENNHSSSKLKEDSPVGNATINNEDAARRIASELTRLDVTMKRIDVSVQTILQRTNLLSCMNSYVKPEKAANQYQCFHTHFQTTLQGIWHKYQNDTGIKNERQSLKHSSNFYVSVLEDIVSQIAFKIFPASSNSTRTVDNTIRISESELSELINNLKLEMMTEVPHHYCCNSKHINVWRPCHSHVVVRKVVDSVYQNILYNSGSQAVLENQIVKGNTDIIHKISKYILKEIMSNHCHLSQHERFTPCSLPCALKNCVKEQTQNQLNLSNVQNNYSNPFIYYATFLEEIISGFLFRIVVSFPEKVMYDKGGKRFEDHLRKITLKLIKHMSAYFKQLNIKIIKSNDKVLCVKELHEDEGFKISDSVYYNICQESGSQLAVYTYVTEGNSSCLENITCLVLAEISDYVVQRDTWEDFLTFSSTGLDADKIIHDIITNIREISEHCSSIGLGSNCPTATTWLKDLIDKLIENFFPPLSNMNTHVEQLSYLSEATYTDLAQQLHQKITDNIEIDAIWDAKKLNVDVKSNAQEVIQQMVHSIYRNILQLYKTNKKFQTVVIINNGAILDRVASIIIIEISKQCRPITSVELSPRSLILTEDSIVDGSLCSNTIHTKLHSSCLQNRELSSSAIYSKSFLEDVISSVLCKIIFNFCVVDAKCRNFVKCGLCQLATQLVNFILIEIKKSKIKVRHIGEEMGYFQTNKNVVNRVVDSVYDDIQKQPGSHQAFKKEIEHNSDGFAERISFLILTKIEKYQLQSSELMVLSFDHYSSLEVNKILQKLESSVMDVCNQLCSLVSRCPTKANGKAVLPVDTRIVDFRKPHVKELPLQTMTIVLSSTIVQDVIAKFLSKLFLNCPTLALETKHVSISKLQNVTERLVNMLLLKISEKQIKIFPDTLETHYAHQKRTHVVEKVVKALYYTVYQLFGCHCSIYESLSSQHTVIAQTVPNLIIAEICNVHLQPYETHGTFLDKCVGIKISYIVQRVLNDITDMAPHSQYLVCNDRGLYAPFLEEILSQFLTKTLVSFLDTKSATTRCTLSEAQLKQVYLKFVNAVLQEILKCKIDIVEPKTLEQCLHFKDNHFIAVIVNSVYINTVKASGGSPCKLFKIMKSDDNDIFKRLSALLMKEIFKYQLHSFPKAGTIHKFYRDIEVAELVQRIHKHIKVHFSIVENAEPFDLISGKMAISEKEVKLDSKLPKIIPYMKNEPLKVDVSLVAEHLSILSIKTEPLDMLNKLFLIQTGQSLESVRSTSVSGRGAADEKTDVLPLLPDFAVNRKNHQRATLDTLGRLNASPKKILCRNSFLNVLKPDVSKVELLKDIQSKQEFLVRLVTHDLQHQDNDGCIEEIVVKDSCLMGSEEELHFGKQYMVKAWFQSTKSSSASKDWQKSTTSSWSDLIVGQRGIHHKSNDVSKAPIGKEYSICNLDIPHFNRSDLMSETLVNRLSWLPTDKIRSLNKILSTTKGIIAFDSAPATSSKKTNLLETSEHDFLKTEHFDTSTIEMEDITDYSLPAAVPSGSSVSLAYANQAEKTSVFTKMSTALSKVFLRKNLSSVKTAEDNI